MGGPGNFHYGTVGLEHPKVEVFEAVLPDARMAKGTVHDGQEGHDLLMDDLEFDIAAKRLSGKKAKKVDAMKQDAEKLDEGMVTSVSQDRTFRVLPFGAKTLLKQAFVVS